MRITVNLFTLFVKKYHFRKVYSQRKNHLTSFNACINMDKNHIYCISDFSAQMLGRRA